MKTQKLLFIVLSIITFNFKLETFNCSAQTNDELFAKGIKLRSELKFKEAFPIFQTLVKADSGNYIYLQNASYCYAKCGFYYAPETEKMKYYQTAEYLAKKAINANDASAEAHFAYAMALGRINENASSKQKVANSKLIKTQVDRAIALNPKLAGAYHILGRWNRAIAGFNAIEKAMINSFFGGVPSGGTYEEAVKAFITAIGIEPKYMNHQYELAETYYEMGKEAEAKVWAQKALTITPANDDDFKAKRDCEALLKKLE